jgi:hypothetical protein
VSRFYADFTLSTFSLNFFQFVTDKNPSEASLGTGVPTTSGSGNRLEIIPGKIPGTLDSKPHELRATAKAAEPA